MTIQDVSKLKSGQVFGDAKLQRELQRLYYTLFNEKLTITCLNCIEDAIFRINYYSKKTQKIMAPSTSLFKLFDSKVLWVNAWGMHITNGNLTDKIAIDLLRLNIKNIKNFEKYPDNYLDLVRGTQLVGEQKKIEGFELNENGEPAETNQPTVEEETHEEEEETQPVMTVQEMIKKYSKAEMIEMLKQKGISVENDNVNTKKELAETLIAFQNKK